MRFFFRSKQFKIIVCIFLSIVLISSIFAAFGKMSPQANLAATITAPFRYVAEIVDNTVGDFFDTFKAQSELMLENSQLKNQINDLQSKLSEYDEALQKNEFYENYLGLKEANSDFTLCDATLIARDSDDPYGSFVINKGSMDGLSVYDPVITNEGLVGFIYETALSTSKVKTILSPDITAGALDNRTADSGIVSGTLELSQKGLCRFYNLSRSCSVSIGDYVVTSGEGIFPEGLLIGTIEEIGSDRYNTSIFATVQPFAKIDELRGVMVITDFEGKINSGEES